MISFKLNILAFLNTTVISQNTGSPLLTLFFETLEKQPCKQKTVLAEE